MNKLNKLNYFLDFVHVCMNAFDLSMYDSEGGVYSSSILRFDTIYCCLFCCCCVCVFFLLSLFLSFT